MPAHNSDSRAGPRSNVYLMAALTCDGLSNSVRVRNLSIEGALLEGAGLPGEGRTVLLRRGSLSADAKIAWRRESQCGIRFDRPIQVLEWVRRAEPAGQQRIDQTIAEFRGTAIDSRPAAVSAAEVQADPRWVGTELLKACERIAALPDMSHGLADELLKIESLARSIAAVPVPR